MVNKRMNEQLPKGLTDRQVDALLDPLYKDVQSSACFTSTEPLLRVAKTVNGALSRADVQRYLHRQRMYTLHRHVVRRFHRLATIASGLHTHWQADLADMQRLRRWNRGFGYLLVCIDILSRQLYVEAVRSKRSADMITAFKAVFKRCGYMPWHVMTDAGKEFTARSVQEYFKEHEIQQHCMHTSPLWHAGMAERANRTIKERLYRYFTHRGERCWLRAIQPIVRAINATPNKSIFGMRPCDVTFANAEQLRRAIAEHAQQERTKAARKFPTFKVGDEVRVEKQRHVFRKGYLPTYSDEVYTITRVRRAPPPTTYRLQNPMDGKQLDGWFYSNQLCLVLDTDRYQGGDERRASKSKQNESNIYEIDSILKRRVDADGKECCLVSWKGFSHKYDSWIPATSII